MTPQDPLGDFIDQKLAEQGRRDLYGPAAGVPVAGTGLGYRTSGPGIRLSEQAVADWSNDVDSGIRNASRAVENFDSAAGRVWGQEDAQAALDGRAALLRQHAGADAYKRELALQRAAEERLRLDALIASGGPRGGAGTAYGDVPTGSSQGGSRITSTIDGMPSTAAYQIVANVDERGVPVSYGAYNKVTGQTDYQIGPTGLGEFMSNSPALTIEAYYRHQAAEARPYERASGQFVMEALNGNLGAAGSAYASSWGEAVQDPHWLTSTAMNLVGAAVGNTAGVVDGVAPTLEQRGLSKLALPRTSGLGPTSTTSELLQTGAIPGREGVVLTQRNVPFDELWKLSDNSGVEFVLTREDGKFILRSGSPTSAPIPGGVRPIAHTHPLDADGLNSLLPSRADINVLNDYWARNPMIQRPVSQIITGPSQTTTFRATGLDPQSTGLKRATMVSSCMRGSDAA